jgi:AhpD family alkylhydroperoxidase
MTKEQIYQEVRQALGQVPGFIQSIPEESLEAEWSLFKRFELEPSSIDPKNRELIGAAVAAAQHCWYCTNFHTALAKFHGATEAEIQEAVHIAKHSTGWSTYLNGTGYDHDQFLNELQAVGAHLQKSRQPEMSDSQTEQTSPRA